MSDVHVALELLKIYDIDFPHLTLNLSLLIARSAKSYAMFGGLQSRGKKRITLNEDREMRKLPSFLFSYLNNTLSFSSKLSNILLIWDKGAKKGCILISCKQNTPCIPN